MPGFLGSIFGGGGSGDGLAAIGRGIFGGRNNRAAARDASRGARIATGAATGTLQGASNRFDPFTAQGAASTNLINSLLGIETPGTFDAQAYLSQNPDVQQYFANLSPREREALQAEGVDPNDPQQLAQYHFQRFGQAEGRQAPLSGGGRSTAGAEGLSAFRNSSGFRDQFDTALQGVTSNAAARGVLNSSGTGQVFQREAANVADRSFGNFFNGLLGQQGVGLQGAGAQGQIDGNAANIQFGGIQQAENLAAQGRGRGIGGFLGRVIGGN